MGSKMNWDAVRRGRNLSIPSSSEERSMKDCCPEGHYLPGGGNCYICRQASKQVSKKKNSTGK